MSEKKNRFPVHFNAQTLVHDASAWVDAEKPPVVAIYTRNRVSVGINRHSGQVVFSPIHDEFVLEDGLEATIVKGEKDWVAGAACVNAATWPHHWSGAKEDEVDLGLMLRVDPTTADRVETLLTEQADDIRKNRLSKAVKDAFDAWASQATAYGEEIARVWPNDKVLLTQDGRLMYSASGGIGASQCRKICRVEGENIFRVDLDTNLEVHEFPQRVSLAAKDLARLRPDHDVEYHRLAEELRVTIAAAKERALSTPLGITFPAVDSLEQDYPQPKLPAKIELKTDGGVSRDRARLHQWYEDARNMLAALGYERVGRDYTSGSGASMSSTWLLKGGISDPREVIPEIIEVDNQRGVIVVPASKAGLASGTNLTKLEELTGRKWTVKSKLDPASISEYCIEIDERSDTLYVRKGYEGRVIGRQGSGIKDIERRTGRRWKVVGR